MLHCFNPHIIVQACASFHWLNILPFRIWRSCYPSGLGVRIIQRTLLPKIEYEKLHSTGYAEKGAPCTQIVQMKRKQKPELADSSPSNGIDMFRGLFLVSSGGDRCVSIAP